MDGLGYRVRASGTLLPLAREGCGYPTEPECSQRRHSMRGKPRRRTTPSGSDTRPFEQGHTSMENVRSRFGGIDGPRVQ